MHKKKAILIAITIIFIYTIWRAEHHQRKKIIKECRTALLRSVVLSVFSGDIYTFAASAFVGPVLNEILT